MFNEPWINNSISLEFCLYTHLLIFKDRVFLVNNVNILRRLKAEGTTEDEMVGWHHRLHGHEFEQAPGVGDGQGSLECCSPQGRNGSDIERLN